MTFKDLERAINDCLANEFPGIRILGTDNFHDDITIDLASNGCEYEIFLFRDPFDEEIYAGCGLVSVDGEVTDSYDSIPNVKAKEIVTNEEEVKKVIREGLTTGTEDLIRKVLNEVHKIREIKFEYVWQKELLGEILSYE